MTASCEFGEDKPGGGEDDDAAFGQDLEAPDSESAFDPAGTAVPSASTLRIMSWNLRHEGWSGETFYADDARQIGYTFGLLEFWKSCATERNPAMREASPAKKTCQICGKEFPSIDVIPGELVRQNIAEEIRKEHSDWSEKSSICIPDLNHYRGHYIQSLMEQEVGELSGLEQQVVRALQDQQTVASNANADFEQERSAGERMSDRIASFGGSWRFIGMFGGVMLVWILVNTIAVFKTPFDPFPYILLNLCLSCLAAIQAPIIMMSQNRQEARDRMRAENDYRVNLKAELEIRLLSDKVDRLISQQWHRLLEIQQIQTDLIEALSSSKK